MRNPWHEIWISRSGGRENGKHGLPPPHAEGLDETEGEIITRINNEWHLASEDFGANILAYSDRLGSLDLGASENDVRTDGQDIRSEINRNFRFGLDHLYTERANVIELENEMASFRRKNRLTDRSADYPNASLFHYAIFFFLILVETVINGLFLGETHVLGFAGGLGEAVIVASVNVFFGLAAVNTSGSMRMVTDCRMMSSKI